MLIVGAEETAERFTASLAAPNLRPTDLDRAYAAGFFDGPAGFNAADQGLCTRLSKTGGTPTYTELLVCLEMARDARKLPKEETLGIGR